jgi:hypothetical protein
MNTLDYQYVVMEPVFFFFGKSKNYNVNNWWYYSYTCVEINFLVVGNPIKGIKIIQIIQTTVKFKFTRHKFHNFVNKNHTKNITMAIQSLLVHTWHPIANY